MAWAGGHFGRTGRPRVTHGPLEAPFTLEEETSMGGALNLAENC